MKRSKVTITNQDNSGTVGVEVDAGLDEAEVELAGMATVCVLLQPLVTPSNSYPDANCGLMR